MSGDQSPCLHIQFGALGFRNPEALFSNLLRGPSTHQLSNIMSNGTKTCKNIVLMLDVVTKLYYYITQTKNEHL